MERATKEYRCVQCGFGIKTLFVQYSPGNIRLMKCEKCKTVADEYIECEIMILLIDLILHKPQAYRHLLHNVLNRNKLDFQGFLWESTLGFFLLDAYRSLLLRIGNKEDASLNFSSLLGICQKVSMDVIFGNLMLLCVFLIATKTFLSTPNELPRFKDLILAIIISSYFKIFLITMMIWEFPSTVVFIIDLLVLSSNAVAVQVITESEMSRCVAACIGAHAAKFLVTQLLDFGLNIFEPSKIVQF